jgi:CDP-glycerol glycerophosphotransferase (TagB/SpsB family)
MVGHAGGLACHITNYVCKLKSNLPWIDMHRFKNNKYKFLIGRVAGILLGLPYSILTLFLTRNNRLVIINSTHNLHFNHNSKYLLEYFIENEKLHSLDVLYIVNNDRKRKKLIEKYGPYFIDNKSFKNKLSILQAYFWVTSTLDTPIGGVFYRYRRFVLHMGHGMPFKNIVYSEKKLSTIKRIYYLLMKTNFTHYLATSSFYKEVIQVSFRCRENQVLILPQPKSDAVCGRIKPLSEIKSKVLNSNAVEFDTNATNIMYAPTWRHFDDIRLFPFSGSLVEIDDFLIDQNVVVWIREHPFFNSNIPRIVGKNIRYFSDKSFEDISEYLLLFDALITDYSSTAIDYLQLKRPIIYLHYDLEKFQNNVGLIEGFNELMVSGTVDTLLEFKDAIKCLTSFCPDSTLNSANNRANNSGYFDVCASSVIFDYLVNVVNEH